MYWNNHRQMRRRNPSVTCGYCGVGNREGKDLCWKCGFDLAATPEDRVSRIQSRAFSRTGQRRRRRNPWLRHNPVLTTYRLCTHCGGKGMVYTGICSVCDGDGRVARRLNPTSFENEYQRPIRSNYYRNPDGIGETPMQKLARTWRGPAAVCTCGHLGDGSDSDHADTFNRGHGACRQCDNCEQFVWKGFTPKYKEALMRARNTGNRNPYIGPLLWP